MGMSQHSSARERGALLSWLNSSLTPDSQNTPSAQSKGRASKTLLGCWVWHSESWESVSSVSSMGHCRVSPDSRVTAQGGVTQGGFGEKSIWGIGAHVQRAQR